MDVTLFAIALQQHLKTKVHHMPATRLECVTINPQQPAQASVIWLHGLGADGHDFTPMVAQLNLPATAAIRFVFPHAPLRTVTINQGMQMRAWFDITSLTVAAKLDEVGIQASTEQLQQLISDEIAQGIAPENIVLAGFSQGGAIALHCGLCYPKKLAGIIALSTFLPLADQLQTNAARSNQDTPIFMAHGTQDSTVQLAWAQQSKKILEEQHYAVQWHTYAMDHGVCTQEITDIAQWLGYLDISWKGV